MVVSRFVAVGPSSGTLGNIVHISFFVLYFHLTPSHKRDEFVDELNNEYRELRDEHYASQVTSKRCLDKFRTNTLDAVLFVVVARLIRLASIRFDVIACVRSTSIDDDLARA